MSACGYELIHTDSFVDFVSYSNDETFEVRPVTSLTDDLGVKPSVVTTIYSSNANEGFSFNIERMQLHVDCGSIEVPSDFTTFEEFDAWMRG